MNRPIMILAGGTGGHIFPAMAVAEELTRMGKPIVWVGAKDSMESEVVTRAGIEFVSMRVQGLRRSGWRRYLRIPMILSAAIVDAVRILRKYRPCAILGMGGFVAGPCGLVGALLRVPLIVHEQNSIVGLTNRLLAPLSHRFFTGFPLQKKNTIHCGNPVRKTLLTLGAEMRTPRSDSLHVLILGGSQGARALNEEVPKALALLSITQPPAVWHQCGRGNESTTAEAYRQLEFDARVEPFIDDMRAAYDWADLVICRSGAMTLAELSAVGLASILVPYPHAVDDHQTTNAQQFVDAGAAVLIAEQNLTSEYLCAQLQDLMQSPKSLGAMGVAAQKFTTGDASVSIAQACIEACQEMRS